MREGTGAASNEARNHSESVDLSEPRFNLFVDYVARSLCRFIPTDLSTIICGTSTSFAISLVLVKKAKGDKERDGLRREFVCISFV